MRIDGRKKNQLRPLKITRNFIKHAEGSVLIEMGDTKVICTATIEERVPPFLRDKKKGWVTAEYAMIPRSSHERIPRESARGKVGGRTHEIQRLIGRSLRAVVDTRGQFVTMLDRTYLMQDLPVQIIWGEDDLIIPVSHARLAHQQMPGSRLEIFEKSGHMPHGDHPERFAAIVEKFIDSTAAFVYDPELQRMALQTGIRQHPRFEPDDNESDLA